MAAPTEESGEEIEWVMRTLATTLLVLSEPLVTILVVYSPCFTVRKRLVCLCNSDELLMSSLVTPRIQSERCGARIHRHRRILIRMKFLAKASIRLFDILVRRRSVYSQKFVEIVCAESQVHQSQENSGKPQQHRLGRTLRECVISKTYITSTRGNELISVITEHCSVIRKTNPRFFSTQSCEFVRYSV